MKRHRRNEKAAAKIISWRKAAKASRNEEIMAAKEEKSCEENIGEEMKIMKSENHEISWRNSEAKMAKMAWRRKAWRNGVMAKNEKKKKPWRQRKRKWRRMA